MAVYTIQRDPPWMSPPRSQSQPQPQSNARSSQYTTTTTTSHYSGEEDPDMTEILPLRVHKSKTKQQVRHSRLPIFKQVRSMLHKAPPTNPTQSDQDVESAANAFRATYETPANRSFGYQDTPTSRSLTPVSALHDDDLVLYPSSPPQLECASPVSPISASPSLHYAREHKMRPLQVHVPTMPKTPAPMIIKRKPAPGRLSLSSNTPASTPPSRSNNNTTDYVIKGSHFSWTTGVPSPTSTRAPSDLWPAADRNSSETPRSCSLPEADSTPKSHFSWTTQATSLTNHTRHGYQPEPDRIPNSHFSWTTQGTSLTHHTRYGYQPQPDHIPNSHFSWTTSGTLQTNHTRPDTPPPSPPPPVPTKYRAPPVKSILSRHRPIQRTEREQWSPPRKSPLPAALYNPTMSSRSKLNLASPKLDEGAGSAKKLPPPPDMSPKTHLESLQREEEDKIHQRRNIQRIISELSKIENASPMEVPFSHVRDAKRRLAELRTTLSEIELEEREIGIAISRTRRKQGEEEALWVRRATG